MGQMELCSKIFKRCVFATRAHLPRHEVVARFLNRFWTTNILVAIRTCEESPRMLYGSVAAAAGGAGKRRAGRGIGAACALAVFSLAVVILVVASSRGAAVAELVEQGEKPAQPDGKLWGWGRHKHHTQKNAHAGKVWVGGSRGKKGFWKWIDPREKDENGERLGDRLMVWKKTTGKKHSKGTWTKASSMDAEDQNVGSYHGFQPLYAPNEEDAALPQGAGS